MFPPSRSSVSGFFLNHLDRFQLVGSACWYLSHGNPFRHAGTSHGNPFVFNTQVVATDAGKFPGHMLLAELETQKGNYKVAIEHYRKALELQPHSPEVLNNLAYLLADKANQPDEALGYAQQAVEAVPGDLDAAESRGNFRLDFVPQRALLGSGATIAAGGRRGPR